jgi:hypothetical protein
MTKAHIAAVVGAGFGAAILLATILFGWKCHLDSIIGVPRTARDIAVALWAFLLPAWFTLEETWFAPTSEGDLIVFRERQRTARLTWLIAGGAVAIVIGLTAQTLPQPPH